VASTGDVGFKTDEEELERDELEEAELEEAELVLRGVLGERDATT
jgi:hypothetical protein